MQENRFFRHVYNSFNQIMGNGALKNFQPQISARMPEAWLGKESITLIAPDGQANVIASTEPLDASVDATRYAEIQGELLRFEFPYYRGLSFNSALVFGNRRGMFAVFNGRRPTVYRLRKFSSLMPNMDAVTRRRQQH